MPAIKKENAALQQAALKYGKASKTKDVAPSRGKKRTLAVAIDLSINLNDAKIPVTKEVVEAMRKRIIDLEEQLEGQSAAKRPKLSSATDEQPKAGPSASSSVQTGKRGTDPKKIDAILKKIWSSMQKEVKLEKYKFRGGIPKSCRIEEVVEEAEFFEIFTHRPDHIHVIQPRSDNKPGSSVHIYKYEPEEIEKIFGKHYKELKGNRYSGLGRMQFVKAQKLGLAPLNINWLEASYSTNTMKCSLRFEVEEKDRASFDEPVCYGWALAL